MVEKMKKGKLKVIIGLFITFVVIVLGGMIVLEVQQKVICEFCIETNWTGEARGELSFNCSDFTLTERGYCYTLLYGG